ncbi:MAG: hypothetical protein JXB85_07930 [Anaerolineales bacterium]|nr:hypothetical protein [Anaerolineales bacterium]
MNLIYEARASTILYNILVARRDRRPFLLPANICPIVPLTFLKAGMGFEFVDISPATLHMDLDAAARLLGTGRFGGLLYAHTYGEPSTPAAFFQELRTAAPSLLLVDDRCLCAPDLAPDLCDPADLILYSSGYAKVVDLGFGGYAFLRDEIPYAPQTLPYRREDLEALERAYKQSVAIRQPFVYADSDWLETGRDRPAWDEYGRSVTDGLARGLAHRRAINAIYAARLPAELQLPPEYQGWRFHLRLERRDLVLQAIFAGGLFASAHYASLAGIMAPGSCPQAEGLAGQVLNLFNDHHFTVAMAAKTCDLILEALA